MFNNNFQNPIQNNGLNGVQNNLPAQNPIQNNPMLQYYQQLMGQFQQPQQPQQDPKIAEYLEEYKKIPDVANNIKEFEEYKSLTNSLEYEINKGFEDYYKSKTDPNFGLIANLTAKIDNLEKLLGGKANNG